MDPETKPAEKLLAVVRQFVESLRPEKRQHLRVTLDSAFEKDLGLDSLSRAELISRVERTWDVTFTEQMFAMAQTPRDLLRAIPQAGIRSTAEQAQAIEVLTRPTDERVPERADTFSSVLDWHVQAHPDRPHIHLYAPDDAVEQMTYGRLRKGAETIAAGLADLGLSPGQTVAIMLPTCTDYFYCFMGIL
ncbi:MAG: AMP-binding protein, partial [Desulfobacteraceae bacterium]